MATPNTSQNVSTPKPHLTPSRNTGTPRPGTANAGKRPFAYKSPAMKTPASAQHSHQIGAPSSQPSSTPLPGINLHDDLLALNSPATALIAGLGSTGLTPLAGGGDGLGITNNMALGHAPNGLSATVSPELQRFHNLRLVLDTLKDRIGGRGITKEGVERIAQIHGFTTLWDDENLTVAGNAVELEIVFDPVQTHVSNATFKLNISETEEPQLQERGTQILKENLAAHNDFSTARQWKSPQDFEANIKYLSQLDHLEGGVPCFDAVKILYETFKKIWDAEETKVSYKGLRQHLKQGATGRATLDQDARLGLSLAYWVRRSTKARHSSDHDGDSIDDPSDLYTAHIGFESGPPSIAWTTNWITDQILSSQVEGSSILDSITDILKPDWQDAYATGQDVDPADKTSSQDVEMQGQGITLPKLLNMHFVLSLLPEVYIPLNVASNLNVELTMLTMKQELATTYHKALQDHMNKATYAEVQPLSGERWSRSLKLGFGTQHHTYALHPAQHGTALWCYPVNQLVFCHPRQVAHVLPILRQHALVWGILRSLVDDRSKDESSLGGLSDVAATNSSSQRRTKRSNAKPTATKLDDLLNKSLRLAGQEALPIDVSLDVMSDLAKTRIDVIVPLRGKSAQNRQKPFIFLSFLVCAGGVLEMKDLRGVQGDNSNDMSLHRGVLRALELTEDLGLVAEKLLERANSRPSG
jgi:hypothetical protein